MVTEGQTQIITLLLTT